MGPDGPGALSLLARGITTGGHGVTPSLLPTSWGRSSPGFAPSSYHHNRIAYASLSLPTRSRLVEEWQRTAEEQVIAEAKQFEKYILRANTEEQLFRRGQDSEGNELFPPYTPSRCQSKEQRPAH